MFVVAVVSNSSTAVCENKTKQNKTKQNKRKETDKKRGGGGINAPLPYIVGNPCWLQKREEQEGKSKRICANTLKGIKIRTTIYNSNATTTTTTTTTTTIDSNVEIAHTYIRLAIEDDS
jgi:hypothetical protein